MTEKQLWLMQQREKNQKQIYARKKAIAKEAKAREAKEIDLKKNPPKVYISKKECWKIHNAKVATLTLASNFGRSFVDRYDFENLFENNIKEIKLISTSEALRLLKPYYTQFCYPAFVKDNFELLQSIGLSRAECDTLAYISVLYGRAKAFDEDKINLSMHAQLISRIFGYRSAVIKDILQIDSKLSKTGFVNISSNLGSGFSSDMLDLVFGVPLSVNTLIKKIGYKQSPSALKLDDFSYMRQKVDMLLHYARASKNGSILLYGKAGVGKSELVSVIAKELGKEMICVKNIIINDEERKGAKAEKRMSAFALMQHTLSSDKHIVLYDECEDTICYNALERKAGINTMLENTKLVNFFVSNSNQMDPAFLRRFDIVCEIKPPPKHKKISLIQSLLDKRKITLDTPLLEAVATNQYLTQGNLIKSANVASKFAKKDVQKIFIKCINETLRAKNVAPIKPKKPKESKEAKESGKMPYSMELIECSTDIVCLSQNIKALCEKPKCKSPLALAKKAAKREGREFDRDFLLDFSGKAQVVPKSSKNCGIRLLAYGSAGSGKSEFAKRLAKECDKKLLSYKMSDLLSMFVGGSEKNIARAFKKAKQKEAILHIDEIDSIGYNREGATHTWERTLVNELLTQMENYDGVFIATSNHLDCLDRAILRRFDSKIEFRPLSPHNLKKAFRMYAEYLGLECDFGDSSVDSSANSSVNFGVDSSTECRAKSSLDSSVKSSTKSSDFANVESHLAKLDNICFGDFALIAREARFAPLKSAQDLLSKLQTESKIKESGRGSTKVGF